MSSAIFYKWCAKYGGMDASLMGNLKELEDENHRLKKISLEGRLKSELRKESHEKNIIDGCCCEGLAVEAGFSLRTLRVTGVLN
jgi:hypothetical protein